MSLRRRLLAGLIGVAGVLVIINVALSSTIQRFLLERVDRQLIEVASRPIFRGDGGRGPGGGPHGFPDDTETLSEYFIAVGDPNDDQLEPLGSAFYDQDEAPLLVRADLLGHLTDRQATPKPYTAAAAQGGGHWRLVAVEDRGTAIVVGLNLDQVTNTVGRIRLVQAFGTLAVLSAIGLVSWWVLRLGVHPIEDMARTADAIAAGDLSQRVLHPGERTEAGRLGVALNTMLARIEEAFHAREASEARVRRFAADASHELRTPLTSIRGYAELWRAGGLRNDQELGEAMRRMEQEAARMGTLVEDLLLLARLDQRRPLELGQVRLDLIAADAVRDARAVEPDRPIELVATPVSVQGDEMRLRQVVGNLLANTRAHTPAASPVRVSVTVDAGGGRARLEVSDRGPGMEPGVAAKVFERFYRADKSRARARGGTGLGLSIVAAIAEAHGGSADVSSEPGQGSVFVVDLPLTQEPAAGDEGAASGGDPGDRAEPAAGDGDPGRADDSQEPHSPLTGNAPAGTGG